MIEADQDSAPNDNSFHAWLIRSFGQVMTEEIFVPFARKRWGWHPDDLDADWATQKLHMAEQTIQLANILSGTDDLVGEKYLYPRRGHSGTIWEAISKSIPREHFRFGPGAEIAAVDIRSKHVVLSDGSTQSYNILINTIPLIQLCDKIVGAENVSALRTATASLRYSSSHFVGIGLSGEIPLHLQDKSWVYCLGEDCSFFRVTVMSNY